MADIDLKAGRYLSSISPKVVGMDAAQFVLNCDTGKGIWQLDTRYRRIMTPPSRTFTASETETVCLPTITPNSVTEALRIGQTHTFTNPSNARIEDGQEAIAAAMVPGSITEILQASLPAPTATIPVTANTVTAKITVRRQVDPDSNTATQIVDDYLRILKNGNTVGPALDQEVVVPIQLSDIEYNVNLLTAGFTIAEINAGAFDGIDLGWKALPDNPTAFDPTNWTIVNTYSANWTIDGVAFNAAGTGNGYSGIEAINSATLSVTVTTTVTYTGTAPAPNYVILQRRSTVTGGTTPYPGTGNPTSGTVTANNGQGTSITAQSSSAAGVSADSTVKTLIPLTAGTGTSVITLTGSAVMGGTPSEAQLGCTIEGSISNTQIVMPDAADLKVDAIHVELCYEADSGNTLTLTGAQGIGYGDFGPNDEITAIWGEGAFKIAADRTTKAMTEANPPYSNELSGKRLGTGQFVLWQYGKWQYITNETHGTYYREIGTTNWSVLFEDTQSPGNTGDATASSILPPYYNAVPFNGAAATDTVTVIAATGRAAGTTAAWTTADDKAKPKLTTGNSGGGYGIGVIDFEITLATVRNLTEGNVMAFRIANVTDTLTEPGNDGFTSGNVADFNLTLTDDSANAKTYPAIITGKLDQQFGYMYAFVDVTDRGTVDFTDIKKIRIEFATRMTGTAIFVLDSLLNGGILYHDLTGNLNTKNPGSETPLEYAYWYSEGPTVGQARKLVISATRHLGDTRAYANFPDGDKSPYLGSQQILNVPTGDSPFTAAATIHVARFCDNQWQQLTTATNATPLVFTDQIPDSTLNADTTTYPIVTPDFDSETPIPSGTVGGIITGCAWKGSNVYSHTNGKLYISRQNYPNEVLWDNVTLTNEVGSVDLGPPRTATLADNTADYAIALIPTENLYAATRRDVWVMIAGETAATASFPRRIDGVRGVIGRRAACAFGNKALIGCDDGLWAVQKSSNYGEQPDSLEEITRQDRQAWLDLIKADPEATVVRYHLGEIWAFNRHQYLHWTRQNACIYGAWSCGRNVVDAIADPFRGLILQLSDGHLGIIGPYITDGGTNLEGDNGAIPQWIYRTGRENQHRIERATVYGETTKPLTNNVRITLRTATENSTTTYPTQHITQIIGNASFKKFGPRSWSEIEVTGDATDTVHRIALDLTPLPQNRNA